MNSEGNLCHAYNSLLHQLEADKEDVREENKDELVQSVSYLLTKNLVVSKIKERADHKQYFQFKLALEFQGNASDCQDILFSIVHEV